MIALLIPTSVDAGIGWKFLTIPQGAREVSMGETGVSRANGSSAIWWNPAHFADYRAEAWFQGYTWIGEGTGSYGGVKGKTRWGGFGAWYAHHGISLMSLFQLGCSSIGFGVHM